MIFLDFVKTMMSSLHFAVQPLELKKKFKINTKLNQYLWYIEIFVESNISYHPLQ